MKNTWGLYPWFYDEDEHKYLVHPEDLKKFADLYPYGKVFYCRESMDYLLLQFHSDVFRVKPDLYTQVLAPKFNFGDHVKDVRSPERIGVIREIQWHYKYNRPFYHLITPEGKRVSKRYFDDDLTDALSTA